MGAHIDANGQFQSDKYPTCPAGKVPLSVTDPTAQDLLWEYAQRRRSVDAEFSDDLEMALRAAGFRPKTLGPVDSTLVIVCAACQRASCWQDALPCAAADGRAKQMRRDALARMRLEDPCYWTDYAIRDGGADR